MNDNLVRIKETIIHPNKKILKSLSMLGGIVVIFLIILFILKITIFSKIPTYKLENKMIIAAKKYYKQNKKQLPEFDKDTATVSIDNLIDSGYLKTLDKLLKNKNTTCTGTVTVTNNNNYYLYTTDIACSDKYKTKKLNKVITNAGNIVTSGDGLYEIDEDFVYRGEKVNNYIEFAGQLWRILRVNGDDNSIKLLQANPSDTKYVWDDRYNEAKKSNTGINDYTISRIKDSINELWNSKDVFSTNQKAYISTQDLCIGAREKDEVNNDGSVECSLTDGVTSITAIKPSDYMIVSLDSECESISNKQCTNYNYLANLKNIFWTITADANTSYYVYAIKKTPKLVKASSSTYLRLVVNLSSEVNWASGDGTEEKPYKVK